MPDQPKDDVARCGNLTRDPELRYSTKGTPIAGFGLAFRPFVPKGEPEPETTFYEVVTFGSLAEHVAESLRKGDRALVIGKGELEHWTAKDGTAKTTRKIVADSCGPDLRFTTAELARTERQAPPSQPAGRTAPASSYGDEEPF